MFGRYAKIGMRCHGNVKDRRIFGWQRGGYNHDKERKTINVRQVEILSHRFWNIELEPFRIRCTQEYKGIVRLFVSLPNNSDLNIQPLITFYISFHPLVQFIQLSRYLFEWYDNDEERTISRLRTYYEVHWIKLFKTEEISQVEQIT